jgi:hypothetical protein
MFGESKKLVSNVTKQLDEQRLKETSQMLSLDCDRVLSDGHQTMNPLGSNLSSSTSQLTRKRSYTILPTSVSLNRLGGAHSRFRKLENGTPNVMSSSVSVSERAAEKSQFNLHFCGSPVTFNPNPNPNPQQSSSLDINNSNIWSEIDPSHYEDVASSPIFFTTSFPHKKANVKASCTSQKAVAANISYFSPRSSPSYSIPDHSDDADATCRHQLGLQSLEHNQQQHLHNQQTQKQEHIRIHIQEKTQQEEEQIPLQIQPLESYLPPIAPPRWYERDNPNRVAVGVEVSTVSATRRIRSILNHLK